MTGKTTGKIAAGISAAGIAAGCFGVIDKLHLRTSAPGTKVRIACVGDSITYGCFVSGQPWNSYPARLGRLLGSDYYVANFGCTNRTAISAADHPYTKERLYRKSLDYGPDMVLLMLGTNDSKMHNWDAEAYRHDMLSLIDSYRKLDSHPEIIIMLPPPVFTIHRRVMWQIRPDILEREVIPACRRIAEERGLRLIDTHSPFMLRRHLFVDGVHPNARGAEVLARTVYKAIREERI